MAFFTKVEKNIPKMYMEPQKTLNSQGNPKKNKAGGVTLSDFKLHYKAIVIKTV